MNFAIAVALLLLLGLLTLVSYVDRLYTEIGKFLSREFQDNINAFEQRIEPKLHVSRARASLSMAILTQLVIAAIGMRSEEHTSELQSHSDLVCRLLLEKKKKKKLTKLDYEKKL